MIFSVFYFNQEVKYIKMSYDFFNFLSYLVADNMLFL
jgi:hypothetical protein